MTLQPVAEFFELDDFAEEADYTPVGGSLTVIRVIFNEPHSVIPLGETEYQSAFPSVWCKTSEVSSARNGDIVVYDNTTYYVRETRHDGTGMTLLELSKDYGA